MTDNPADRSGEVNREPLKKKLEQITSTQPTYNCVSCEKEIEDNEEMLSVNSQTVHKKCFFEDMTEEEEA